MIKNLFSYVNKDKLSINRDQRICPYFKPQTTNVVLLKGCSKQHSFSMELCCCQEQYWHEDQRRRILKFSFFVSMFQTCDPRGGAQFDPKGII